MTTGEDAMQEANADTGAALARARDVSDAWFRCQALARVARYAPEQDVESIAAEALLAAAAGKDAYQKVAVSAWPIRALIERGALGRAETAMRTALSLAPNVAHTGARAEALLLMFHATFPAPSMWRETLDAMLEIPHPPLHWRHGRALRDAFLLVNVKDPEFGTERFQRVRDEKTMGQIRRGIAGSRGSLPRPFFW